ncbi:MULTISPECIES: MerR family DNA-binding transcriptional regulator [unclassified Micromonospora]|uniref:MerR family DNA-binding transcriptional regulator n=1 Tax=unclassified Micromonospora TaxID=2617518 RepID=UPI003334A4F3
MNGDTLYSIGELARRTGLTVKAIRFYSDRGIVPPTGRGPTGPAAAPGACAVTPSRWSATRSSRRDGRASTRSHPRADTVVATVMTRYGDLCGRPDDVDLRRRMLARLESASDPRRERYLRLLSVVNGWPAADSLASVLDWSVRALRARLPGPAVR